MKNKLTTLLICAVISVSLACTISLGVDIRSTPNVFDYHSVLTPWHQATPLTEAGAKVREWKP